MKYYSVVSRILTDFAEFYKPPNKFKIRKKPTYRVQSQESALDSHQSTAQPRDWMLEERGTLV